MTIPMNFYEKNMDILKGIDKELYEKMLTFNVDLDKYSVVQTRDGDYTVKVTIDEGGRGVDFFLHSKYDPYREADTFAKGQIKGDSRVNILYGFGLGYHVEKMLDYIGAEDELHVFEINLSIFKLALENRDLSNVFRDKRLKLTVSDNISYIAQKITSVVNYTEALILHMTSIKSLSDEYGDFKLALEKWHTKENLNEKWGGMLSKNYEENMKLEYTNIGELFDRSRKIPIIIVSSGPSLNKNKHLLKELKGKALIFAAGSALKPLLRIGVEPDIFCLMDPQAITCKQIEGYEDMDIPLVFLDTANYLTVLAYEGPEYIASSKESHGVAENYIVNSGGSVATAIMDMAIKLGGNPIVFVGQNLSFTNNEHHADGNMYGEAVKINSLPNMRKVKGQNGEWLDTTIGYLMFKTWIENKIINHPEVEFINATEGGAYIEGSMHVRLEELIKKFEYDNEAQLLIDELNRSLRIKGTYNKKIDVLTFDVNII